MLAPKPAQQHFYRALGHAITNWQGVEAGLYVLVHCCLGTSAERSSIAFFHIKSAESKLGLADKLCRLDLVEKTYRAHWVPLRKKITANVDLRNALAHFEASWVPPQAKGKTAFPIALTPNSLDQARAREDGNVPALFVEQLHELAEDFLIRSKELIAFSRSHLPGWQQHASTLPRDLRQALGIDRGKTS